MKKFILTLLIAFSALGMQAQDAALEWHTDFNKALELSNSTKKPMMLFFTGSDWCGWCMKLQKEVFKTPEFVAWAKENVILVELDFPRRKEQTPEIKAQNAQIGAALKVRGYPTVWFVSSSKTKEGKTNLTPTGSTGYVAGGPSAWLAAANPFVKKT
jgi:protein disulfide-isomerase